MSEPTRFERDSFGDIAVPAARLWGAQTQRSLQFFAISTERMPGELVAALVEVKRAAAIVNRDLGLLAALLIFGLGEIFARGVQLQHEQNLTI